MEIYVINGRLDSMYSDKEKAIRAAKARKRIIQEPTELWQMKDYNGQFVNEELVLKL